MFCVFSGVLLLCCYIVMCMARASNLVFGPGSWLRGGRFTCKLLYHVIEAGVDTVVFEYMHQYVPS